MVQRALPRHRSRTFGHPRCSSPPPETGLCCTAVAPLAVAVLDEYNSTLAHGAGAGAAITIRLPS
eukprot:6330633-Prymnesium_polylepis.1